MARFFYAAEAERVFLLRRLGLTNSRAPRHNLRKAACVFFAMKAGRFFFAAEARIVFFWAAEARAHSLTCSSAESAEAARVYLFAMEAGHVFLPWRPRAFFVFAAEAPAHSLTHPSAEDAAITKKPPQQQKKRVPTER